MNVWMKLYRETIQMKATKQSFSVVQFIMLYKLVLTFESVAIQMKGTEQYFSLLVLFIILYKVALTFDSVGEILWCDHSNESY